MNPVSLSESYRRDGLIRSFDVLNDDEIESINLKLRAFISDHQQKPDFSNWVYSKSYLALRWVADLASHPCILDHVAALIGDDILLWDASIPLKGPKSKGYFGWHQDATYWPLEPADEMLAVWLAISDVNLTNGGMRAIPGSHKQGQRPHTATRHTSSMLRRGQQIDDQIDDQNAIEISLRAGQASIHHPLTIHGSGGNPSCQWRYGIIFNYVSAQATVKNGHVESGLLVRGRPPTNRMLLEKKPDADLSDAALMAYGDAISRSSQRYADI